MASWKNAVWQMKVLIQYIRFSSLHTHSSYIHQRSSPNVFCLSNEFTCFALLTLTMLNKIFRSYVLKPLQLGTLIFGYIETQIVTCICKTWAIQYGYFSEASLRFMRIVAVRVREVRAGTVNEFEIARWIHRTF